ncbi:hypothetical protein Vid5_gp81 [Pantoea phage vB_PagS_Vid5]|uniref:Uncharacterized protein n=1 Tax=Pantoea phage vB_PagS_Vid5 TaxID=2099652 RepID=A0A2P1CKR5_9CAUD|nr:hypothetical protein FDJ45_gp074 [Pantoea phage vB_PagS_Vid5]AVJ51836.1 hypothetical protein Vid5_gp81 [Pantoea phage vB_PagS_Vid5]
MPASYKSSLYKLFITMLKSLRVLQSARRANTALASSVLDCTSYTAHSAAIDFRVRLPICKAALMSYTVLRVTVSILLSFK